jgi:hypothetical protein
MAIVHVYRSGEEESDKIQEKIMAVKYYKLAKEVSIYITRFIIFLL